MSVQCNHQWDSAYTLYKTIQHNTWRHFFYLSLSHWWKSIWIMRRSTCHTWLSWHTDRSPNTYIHPKGGERELKRRSAHSLHCGVPACFFNHIPQSLNRQLPERCRCCNTASITSLSMRNSCSAMRSISLTTPDVEYIPFEEHATQSVPVVVSKSIQKHSTATWLIEFWVVFLQHEGSQHTSNYQWQLLCQRAAIWPPSFSLCFSLCTVHSLSRTFLFPICESTCNPINLTPTPYRPLCAMLHPVSHRLSRG